MSLFDPAVIVRRLFSISFLILGGLAAITTAGSAAPVVVADFDFDDEFGNPDAQDWRPLVLNTSEETHFHVEDFSGVDHVAAPLQGSQSMWCGLPAEDPRTCHWNSPPGYGSNWNEILSSTAFAVQGDVSFEFLVDMSIEPGYDYVYLEYEDPLGEWVNLDTYNCGGYSCGPLSKQYVVAAAAHDGQIRFRFRFHSDGAGDSEGFAFVPSAKGFLVDSLTVSDATGIVDTQDFEGEAVGDSATADGHWYTELYAPGDNAGLLVSGVDMLQETTPVNETGMWSFLDGAIDDYSCAGHPEQAVVPATRSIVRSPIIELNRDLDGYFIGGTIDSVEVAFDVYRDLDPHHQKWYRWMVSSYSDDCLLDREAVVNFDPANQKDWYRQSFVFVPADGTTRIEVDLGVDNANLVEGQCRSHAPLFDNVTVTRFSDTVTAAEPQTARRGLVLHQNHPNPFNPTTNIEYEVPAGGNRVTLRIYNSAGQLVRTLVDESQGPGPRNARWDGKGASGEPVASGVYFYRLKVGQAEASRQMVLLK